MEFNERDLVLFLIDEYKRLNYTQENLAYDLGISKSDITKYKNGGNPTHLTGDNAEKIVNKLLKNIEPNESMLNNLNEYIRGTGFKELTTTDEIKSFLERGIQTKYTSDTKSKKNTADDNDGDKHYELDKSGNFAIDNIFIGREAILDDIESNICDSPVILYGDGGIGKTTIALRYAKEKRDQFSARQIVTFNGSLKDLINSLKVKCNGQKYNGDKTDILTKLEGENLIIFDNVDDVSKDLDIDLFRKWIGSEDVNAQIIITTRIKDENTFGNATYIHVEELTEDEQLYLFQEYLGDELRNDEIPVVREIIREIHGNTLFINIVAKTMENGEKANDILEWLKRGGDSTVSINVKKPNHENASGTMITALESLLLNTLGDDDKELLKLLYLLPNSGDENISTADFKNVYGNIDTLLNHGWLTKKGRKLILHPVIRDVIKGIDRADEDKYINVLEIIKNCKISENTMCEVYHNLAFVLDTIPQTECENTLRFAELLSENYKYLYSLEIYEKLVKSNSIDKSDIYSRIGDLYKRLADYDEAIRNYEYATEHCSDEVQKARIIRKIGEVCRKDSKYKEALENNGKAMEVFKQESKNDPSLLLDLAEVTNATGIIYLNMADNTITNAKEKEEYYIQSKTMYETAYKKWVELINANLDCINKRDVLTKSIYTTHNLGTLNQRLGNYTEAIKYHTAALNARIKNGEKETEIAASQIQIANDYISMINSTTNSDEKAEYSAKVLEYLQAGMQIRERILGKEHPDYAWGLSAYCDYFCAIKKYDKALECINEVVRIRKNKIGEAHKYTERAIKKQNEIRENLQ